ncbi:hypothetical protein B7494_g2590 [Chlorociboria aeruginascens]|nr:hypothetical protein B7494_g2590 [Chlorociboria aeruginascens]
MPGAQRHQYAASSRCHEPGNYGLQFALGNIVLPKRLGRKCPELRDGISDSRQQEDVPSPSPPTNHGSPEIKRFFLLFQSQSNPIQSNPILSIGRRRRRRGEGKENVWGIFYNLHMEVFKVLINVNTMSGHDKKARGSRQGTKDNKSPIATPPAARLQRSKNNEHGEENTSASSKAKPATVGGGGGGGGGGGEGEGEEGEGEGEEGEGEEGEGEGKEEEEEEEGEGGEIRKRNESYEVHDEG